MTATGPKRQRRWKKYAGKVGDVFGVFTVLEIYSTLEKHYPIRKQHATRPRTMCVCRCECGLVDTKILNPLGLARRKFCGRECKFRFTPNRKIQILYDMNKGSAKANGHDWKLSLPEYSSLITGNCTYCNKAPETKSGTSYKQKKLNSFARNGIDRVNTDLGYIADNCVSCCQQCNIGKLDYPVEEFLIWVQRVYNWTTKRR